LNRYRFELLLTLILIINGAWACGGSSPTPELTVQNINPPEPTVQDITPIVETPTQEVKLVSVFEMSGLPPTPTRELPVIVSEHDADIPEAKTELEVLQSLWLGSLPPLPPDPSNAVADNPQAAQLGQRLFFDTRFSANGEVACATCHKPELMFTDGLPLAEGIGTTGHNTMSIVGTAYNAWFFWDGRRDSQWSQALTPWEDPAEHGGTRTQYVHIIEEDPTYRSEYEAIFGTLPDFSDRTRFPDTAGSLGDVDAKAAWEAMASSDRETVTQVYVNLGKVIAAYERLIIPGPSRFDTYVEAALQEDEAAMQASLSPDEVAGMRIFISENCIYCHNGALFTDNKFYNVGVPNAEDLPLDVGRFQGLQTVFSNDFNCLGRYSDAGPDDCTTLTALDTGGLELRGAFKVPSLRNVAETAPYMSSGQYATLREVLEHYNKAERGPFDHTEVKPLNFSDTELEQLEAFLRTLSGSLAVDPKLLEPPTE